MLVEEIEYRNHTIKIYQDQHAEPPRSYATDTTMLCFHKRYDLGDTVDDLSVDDFDSWESVKAHLMFNYKLVGILPIYLYDHSGITIQTEPFGCRWDSGQIGYIYMTKDQFSKLDLDQIAQQYPELTEKRDIINYILKEDVAEVDNYITGNIYYFEIDDICEMYYTYGGIDYEKSGLLVDARKEIDNYLKKQKLNDQQPQKNIQLSI